MNNENDRSCGASCYLAVGKHCDCWCGGVFHGSGGAKARKALLASVGRLPATQAEAKMIPARKLWEGYRLIGAKPPMQLQAAGRQLEAQRRLK